MVELRFVMFVPSFFFFFFPVYNSINSFFSLFTKLNIPVFRHTKKKKKKKLLKPHKPRSKPQPTCIIDSKLSQALSLQTGLSSDSLFNSPSLLPLLLTLHIRS